MPNVLVISLEEFSFSSRQLYEHLLPKLLSRAAIHEATTVQDALNYILSGWPNVILIADPVIAEDTDEHRRLLEVVADHTRHGCTTVLMGLFAVAIESETLDSRFKEYFDLRWRVAESTLTRHGVTAHHEVKGQSRTPRHRSCIQPRSVAVQPRETCVTLHPSAYTVQPREPSLCSHSVGCRTTTEGS